MSRSVIPRAGAIRQRQSARGRYARRNSSRRMRSRSRSMIGNAPIRHEFRVRPLARAISPGRGALVERGTWRLLGLSIRDAPDESMTGESKARSAALITWKGGVRAEIPADMVVSRQKNQGIHEVHHISYDESP